MNTRQQLLLDKENIINLYNNGLTPIEISRKLNYKYFQPIYNLLIKEKIYKPSEPSTRNKKRKYNVNEQYFDNIDTEEKAYILGFIAADGYVSHNSLVISLNERDVDILEKIKKELQAEHPIKYFVKDNKYKHVLLKINSVYLTSILNKYDLFSNKSLTMGNIIKHVPDQFKIAFCRGYFDGDGNIFYGVKYSSGTKYLITVIGTLEFLETSFKQLFETNCKISKYKSCNMHAFKISKKSQVDLFLEILYSNASIYLNRKYKCAHVKLH